MSELFRKMWLDKAYERRMVMQDAIEEEDTENQRVLDEEEVEYGHVDDSDNEMVDYARDPEDGRYNFGNAYIKEDFGALDQKLEDDFEDQNLDFHLQSEGMVADNDLPEGSQRQEFELAPLGCNSSAISQYALYKIPSLIYFSPEDLEKYYAVSGTSRATTAMQEEEFDFDFDGSYFYNDQDTTMQEALCFLRSHQDVRDEALQRFHGELLHRSKLVVDLDELERLRQ